VFSLVLVLIIGQRINGAKSWIVLGPISIQPLEIARIGFIVVLAAVLDRAERQVSNFRVLGLVVLLTMNRLGMLVDLSHASERAFFDALETSARPVIASHSGCRAVFDHQRNLTDDQLRALAAHGGVIGIVFHPGFLDGAARAEETRVRALPAYRDAPGADPAAVQLERQRVMRALAAPLPAERLVAHVLHAVEVAGIDHVGIGSDYDGIDRGPEWLEDASCYGVLAELLLQRGFSADDVAKVLGGNVERVFAAATGPGTRAHGRAIAPLAAGVETG
jgi:membrane dipeptidase